MGLFHDHVWVDVNDYDFHPPAFPSLLTGHDIELKGSHDLLQKMLNGWTVFHQRCTCGEVRDQQVLGRYEGQK